MTKLLVYSEVMPAAVKELKKIGKVVQDKLDDEGKFCKLVEDVDVLVIRSKPKVSKKVVEAAKNLKIIGRAGVSISNIEMDAQKLCKERGIKILNTPAATSVSVAELTVGLGISLLRNISQGDATVKAGGWSRGKFMGSELQGKTWGIIGLGRIGSAVAQRLNAFNVKVVAFNPKLSADECRKRGAERIPNWEQFLEACDIISIHVPVTPETENMFNKGTFAKMKDGSYLINIARGKIVDTGALISALKSGKLAGAALDVYTQEPPEKSELMGMENVVLTPHLGASTREGQLRSATDLVGLIKENL